MEVGKEGGGGEIRIRVEIGGGGEIREEEDEK